jgi:hypothetical protein
MKLKRLNNVISYQITTSPLVQSEKQLISPSKSLLFSYCGVRSCNSQIYELIHTIYDSFYALGIQHGLSIVDMNGYESEY